MKNLDTHISKITAGITLLIGFFFLRWWFATDPTADFTASTPGMDNKPSAEELAANEDAVIIGESFAVYDGTPSDRPGQWVQFRGEDVDNIVKDGVKLADAWPESGPEILWGLDLGEGHAGTAVKAGRVFLLDYDEELKADALKCLSLDDGKEIWRRWYKVKVKRNHGLSRTVPAVKDNFVVTMGPRCHVMCVTADSGKFLWGMDLEKEYGTQTPFWYTGQCPVIFDSIAVIAPSGSVFMMGVRLTDGEIVWETPNPEGWQMSHVSVMPMTLGGRKMAVYSAIGGMAGVALDGDNPGEILWQTTEWHHSVLAPSPVIMPDGKIFLTAGYGAGSMVLQVSESDSIFSVEVLQEFSPKDGMACEQQTPILYEGHLFSIQPKDAGSLRQQFVCYRPDDCTDLVWTSGDERFGLGPFIVADGKFYILSDDGVLTMAEASTRGWRMLGQAQVLHGHDAWAPLAVIDGKMILRDSRHLVCINLK